MNDEEELLNLYEEFYRQRNKEWSKKYPNIEISSKDPFIEWLQRIEGVCPWGYITENSKYWLETIGLCDGELGVQMPGNINELPDLFFKALKIVRNERAEILAKEKNSGGQKNSN